MSARYRFRLGAPALAGGLATLLLLLAGAPCAVRADEDFSTCGAVPYLPSEYACYGNATLCPVTFGVASAPCAGSCYVPGLHACVDGAVKPLPEATSPFTLVVHAVSSRLNGLDVKACGNFLAIGAGARRCVSCRGAAQGVNCGAYGNQTVLLPSGEMATDVEGGQYWYVNPDEGILQYSKVGSNGTEKSIAGQSVKIYEGGLLRYKSSPYFWLACIRYLPGGNPGTAKVWRIYAPNYQNLEREDCESVKLVTTPVKDRKAGAFRYD